MAVPTARPKGENDFDLRPYVRVLSRRKWIVIIITVLAGVTALYLSNQQTPKYRSTAELLFKSSAADLINQSGAGAAGVNTRVLASEIKILKGQAVLARVTDQIGPVPEVSVTAQEEEGVIAISAVSSDRERAAEIANVYAKAYIDHRRETTLDEVATAQKAIQVRIDQVRAQIDEKNRQIAVAPREQTGGLESERQALLSQEFGFRQQFSQLQFRADLSGGGVEIVADARPASVPFEPTPTRSAILAGSIALVFALGLAFFVDFLDDTIQTKEDLERAAPGVPILAVIPAVPRTKQVQIKSLEEPTSPFAEAFRTLRTSIEFMGLDEPVRMFQVASPSPGEGKSTTVANLAVAFARAGRRVVAVDCDLRRPRLKDFFGLSEGPGFTSVLLNETSLVGALTDIPAGSLKVLPAGGLPPNPSELLSSRRAAETLAVLKVRSEFVLVDSAPVLAVSDAAVLSKLVDGTICVVAAGQTTRRQLHRTVEVLSSLNTKLIGIVLNGVTAKSSDFGMDYRYGYGSQAGDDTGIRRWLGERNAVSRVTTNSWARNGIAGDSWDVPLRSSRPREGNGGRNGGDSG